MQANVFLLTPLQAQQPERAMKNKPFFEEKRDKLIAYSTLEWLNQVENRA